MLLKDLKEFHNSTVEGNGWRKIKPFTICTSLSYHSSISWVYLLQNGCFKIFACQMEMSFLCIDLLSKGWISCIFLVTSLSHEDRQYWEMKKKVSWDKITIHYRPLGLFKGFHATDWEVWERSHRKLAEITFNCPSGYGLLPTDPASRQPQTSECW